MTIRPADARDIPQLLAIERACLAASHWPEETYRKMLAPDSGRLLLVAIENEPVAFLVAGTLGAEWEIENLAVAPQQQRKGFGAALVHELLKFAFGRGATRVFLEVRESNFVARALYASCGFIETGRRRKYYSAPEEDAVLLSCSVLE